MLLVSCGFHVISCFWFLDLILWHERYRYAVRAGDDNPMLRTGATPVKGILTELVPRVRQVVNLHVMHRKASTWTFPCCRLQASKSKVVTVFQAQIFCDGCIHLQLRWLENL